MNTLDMSLYLFVRGWVITTYLTHRETPDGLSSVQKTGSF